MLLRGVVEVFIQPRKALSGFCIWDYVPYSEEGGESYPGSLVGLEGFRKPFWGKKLAGKIFEVKGSGARKPHGKNFEMTFESLRWWFIAYSFWVPSMGIILPIKFIIITAH